MFYHSLIFLALISFSLVSTAVSIPMDADLAAVDATPNAVLHKEVVIVQGGGADKDVAEALVDVERDVSKPHAPVISASFTARNHGGTWQPLVLLVLIIGIAVFFLSCKRSSTK
jgi:hypothetical protein